MRLFLGVAETAGAAFRACRSQPHFSQALTLWFTPVIYGYPDPLQAQRTSTPSG